ncbi:hypothetical protein KL919_000339 [Ogataea angusta]|nr:hypothetical protein KL919_000339 [Ogataea angusta]
MKILLSTVRDKVKLTGKYTPTPAQYSSLCSAAIIEQITPFKLNDTTYTAIARQGGLIDIYNATSSMPLISLTENLRLGSDFMVALNVVDHFLISCSNRGLVSVYNINKLVDEPDLEGGFFMLIEDPVEFCRPLDNPFKFVTGGYNNSLEMYDFRKDYESHQRQTCESTFLRICRSIITIKPVFKTANPKPNGDFPWLKNAVFVRESREDADLTILATTKFGKMLLYKPYFAKVPIQIFQLSPHSINHIATLNKLKILFMDSFNTVGIFDLAAEKVVKQFNVALIGSIASLDCVKINDFSFLVIIASLDKNLRLYRLTLPDCTLALIGISKLSSIVPCLKLIDLDDSVRQLDFRYYDSK